MKFNFLLLIAIFMLVAAGCSTTQRAQVDAATGTIVVAAEKFNDDRLMLSIKSLCSASLSALKRIYGENPPMVANILATCGWSPEMVKMITGMYVQEVPQYTVPLETK